MIVCKYKFNSSIYSNLIPEFNSGYNGYSINDTVDGNIITRTIECDTLPTLMRFGQVWVDGEVQEDYTRCLLEILDMNTSELTACSSMFRYCINLTSINCNWNTSKVTNMYAMFNVCTKLTQLDLSNFNTSQVTNMSYMFSNCTNLTQLDVSNFDTNNVTNMSYMFFNCKNLTQLDVSNFDTSSVTTMYYMFHSCKNLTQLDVSNFDTSNVTTMYCMFSYCKNLTQLDVSNFNTSQVTNMRNMFDNCTNLTQLDVSNFDTSNVNTMDYMFYNCNNLTQLDVSNFNTSNVTTMQSMFNGCKNLTQLDVSNFDTSKVTTMYCMFTSCSNLTQLDLSNFDTSKVTSMHGMFSTCINLTSLDLSNFDTRQVTDMSYMFYNCNKLTQLDLSNFNTSKVTNMDYILSYCNNLLNIGMLYCTHNTINTIASVLPNNVNRTIYYLDEDINFLNIYDYIEYKEYKESSYTLQLNSPLYEGDKIVVKDDKLCHYHKMGKVVLDGSEDWELGYLNGNYNGYKLKGKEYYKDMPLICQAFITKLYTHYVHKSEYAFIAAGESSVDQGGRLVISCSSPSVDEFKQWLQNNPTTVVYELAEPYYEEITPIQSQWVMSIFEESNLDIITSLPIKSNISYSVSILDTNSLEEELNEVITNKTDLTNLLEDEINS